MKKRLFTIVCPLFLFACPPLPQHSAFSKIEYEAYGRGGSEYVLLEEGKLKYVQNRQDTITKTLKNKDYKAIYEQIKDLELSSLENLKVPSTRHRTDGAFAAVLVVWNSEGNEFASPTFDDDNPPNEIKGLVDYIKSLVKKK